ncbi:hypothetical protein SBA3_1530001 [Candidatus Sulfopaludibacter sp. SbA3]|nr:hypothetical protein SBA3_1530001 [Candidatus Sulfopaludibacter sp. SbA3]
MLAVGHIVYVLGKMAPEQWQCIAGPLAEAAVYHCVDLVDIPEAIAHCLGRPRRWVASTCSLSTPGS